MKYPTKILFTKRGAPEEGFLMIASKEDKLPFDVIRSFWTIATPINITRGRHAHYSTEMVIVSLKGSITVRSECIDGSKFEHQLDNPDEGLYIPPLCWHEMKYTKDAIQLVLASTYYNEEDYIRDYNEFKLLSAK